MSLEEKHVIDMDQENTMMSRERFLIRVGVEVCQAYNGVEACEAHSAIHGHLFLHTF